MIAKGDQYCNEALVRILAFSIKCIEELLSKQDSYDLLKQKNLFILENYLFDDNLKDRLQKGRLLAERFGCHFMPLSYRARYLDYLKLFYNIASITLKNVSPKSTVHFEAFDEAGPSEQEEALPQWE